MQTNKYITKETIIKTLSERFEKEELEMTLASLPSPFLLKDMQKSVERIIEAIKKNEKICVVGDYDADGVDSTVLLKLFFDELGYPIDWIIPNRFLHGYGISPIIVEQLVANNIDLAITVDNGISGVEAGEECAKAGIDLIITDHHLVPAHPPKAYAIINPHQKECAFPYKNICGAQIAWYLIAALRKILERKDISLLYYLQLAAVATIADMMPLKNINRVMVKKGLDSISSKKTRTVPALEFFMDIQGYSSVSAQDVGFFLAPRLNSAGRMDDAKHAANFLMSKSKSHAAEFYATIEGMNTERKNVEQEITEKAMLQISDADSFVVVSGEDWHEGVLGIVASKIGQKTRKPVIVFTKSSEKGILKGSGRSYCDIDLFNTVNDSRELLVKFGGHAAAIGLSIESSMLDDLKKQLNKTASERKYIKSDEINPILGNILFSEISFDLYSTLEKFSPYGQENPYPEFSSENVFVEDITFMGDSDQHFRATLVVEGVSFPGVCFYYDKKMKKNQYYNITFTINKNTFRGKDTLQLFISEFTESSS